MNKTSNYDIVKFIDGEFELEVNVSPEEEIIWLTQEQIVFLFNSTKQNISMHINNILGSNELSISTVKEILTVRYEEKRKVKRKIYQEKELDENITRAKNARHLEDGRIFQVDVYNLDVIIAVGYRVNSKRGTLFRQWANKILKEYLLKGYVINDERTLITNDNYARLINKEFELEVNVSPKEETIWLTQ